MKRSAFTLVELIFVIVIIGVLAAVAVPKFTKLKGTAEGKKAATQLLDLARQARETKIYDEDNLSAANLFDSLAAEGWDTTDEDNITYSESGVVSYIDIDRNNRIIYYHINCDNLQTQESQDACAKVLSKDGTTTSLDGNYTF